MSTLSERQVFDALVAFLVISGIVVALALRRRAAPYGRHAIEDRGPRVRARLAWVVMESPAVVLFAAIYFSGQHAFQAVPLALLGMWQLHYVHRTFVFPLRTRGSKAIPRYIVMTALAFNCINAYINARWLSEWSSYAPNWLTDPRFGLGVFIFVVGMWINLNSDAALRSLRRPGERDYAIPRGGLFTWVSCPNYLGELLEWIGFAVASWSPAAAVFAWFTAANLLPRAVAHHAWYLATFSDYPRQRRAVIPFVL